LIYRWKDLPRSQQYFFVFLLVIFLRAVFSLTVGLIDDEAYHWSWSKELMLSYYDHPGMIAWLNWLSTSLFGDTLLGVRLPSYLCYITTVLLSYFLGKDLFDEKAGAFTALMLFFTPFWGFGGYVASPEPPFMLCWIAAAWIFWQGVRPDEKRWSTSKTWICLGVVMGLGLNSKFIMVLLAPGFGLYLLLTPERRKDLLKPWPWVGFLIATALCLPIFLWNIQYDWPGFRYQFHDRHTGAEFSLNRWLGWWGAQWGLMTPLLYPLLLAAIFVASKRLKQAPWRLILCLSLPSLLVFYPQPFFADYKPHWSGAAYLLLCLGAGALWSQGLEIRHRWWIQPQSQRIKWAFIVLLVPLNIFVYSLFVYPYLPKIYKSFKPQGQWNVRNDPSNEFFGWKELGEFVNRRQREIHAETGHKPFIAALRYENTAQTYWGTHQKSYMLSFTRSHYTVMHQYHSEWQQLYGLDALVVTTEKYPANPIQWDKFDSCQPEEFKTYRAGELSRDFTVWYCKNFQGVLK
jgi:4-amino-4-deoxy-L-arabinose transferase-like glycosyltransferase